MDSHTFQFTLSMPGDSRLMGTIRAVAAHAASYAKQPAEVGTALADSVAAATETLIAASHAQDAPLEYTFAGRKDAIDITISCEVASTSRSPEPSSRDDLSVDWSRDGLRQTCHIRQRISP